eukprot:2351213-Pyramimonas_sp.AAC.1
MQKVPLGALWDKDQRRGFSSSTTALVVFQALLLRCRQSAAGSAGRRGRVVSPQLARQAGATQPVGGNFQGARGARQGRFRGSELREELDMEVSRKRTQDAKASMKGVEGAGGGDCRGRGQSSTCLLEADPL